MRGIRTVRALLALALLGFCASHSSADAKSRKVVFIAGPKDHGVPGRHEYEKDLRVLAYCLEHSSILKGVTTKVYVGQAPKDISELKSAAVIVIESSSDRAPKETHALFPNNAATDGKTYDQATLAYLKKFDALMKKGVGLVVFHYSTWVEHQTGRQFWTDWLGGFWQGKVSANPVDQWLMTPKNENHPVLRGVRPWTYKEEVFCRFILAPNPQRTELLIGTPEKGAGVGPQVVSWAYERQGGGRAFVMGGLDWHSNLLIEDNRRFLLNGIVWAGRMEVPAGGVASSVPESMVK
jgi:type 1 glutamine amidotransferase